MMATWRHAYILKIAIDAQVDAPLMTILFRDGLYSTFHRISAMCCLLQTATGRYALLRVSLVFGSLVAIACLSSRPPPGPF